MSYLDRLKAEVSGKCQPGEPTKPTKAPSVTFVSAEGGHVSENKCAIPGPEAHSETPRGSVAEVRRLIEVVAKVSPYWTPHDVEEAVQIAQGDLDNALITYRELAKQYGAAVH